MVQCIRKGKLKCSPVEPPGETQMTHPSHVSLVEDINLAHKVSHNLVKKFSPNPESEYHPQTFILESCLKQLRQDIILSSEFNARMILRFALLEATIKVCLPFENLDIERFRKKVQETLCEDYLRDLSLGILAEELGKEIISKAKKENKEKGE